MGVNSSSVPSNYKKLFLLLSLSIYLCIFSRESYSSKCSCSVQHIGGIFFICKIFKQSSSNF